MHLCTIMTLEMLSSTMVMP